MDEKPHKRGRPRLSESGSASKTAKSKKLTDDDFEESEDVKEEKAVKTEKGDKADKGEKGLKNYLKQMEVRICDEMEKRIACQLQALQENILAIINDQTKK